MQRRKRLGTAPKWQVPEPLQSQLRLTAMVAIAAAPLALLAAVLPAPLVLPTLCLIAIAAAGAASWFARHGRFARQAQRHAAWDVAGGLAFIACAAAILSNPEQLIQLVDTGASTTASE